MASMGLDQEITSGGQECEPSVVTGCMAGHALEPGATDDKRSPFRCPEPTSADKNLPEREPTLDEQQGLTEHLPMVRYIARRIHSRLPKHVELEELVGAGVLGLVDAFRKFDSTKQAHFLTYAKFRIRGAILDSIRTLDWGSRELRRKGRAIQEAIRTVTVRQGRAASEQEIALELQMALGEYQQLLGELKGLEIGSLHVQYREGSEEERMVYVPGRPDENPLFQCLQGEMQQRLTDAVAALPERERLVLTLYYYEELTMKEIALTLGIVESRVSQIHASAVLHLRSALASMAHPRVSERVQSPVSGHVARYAIPRRRPSR